MSQTPFTKFGFDTEFFELVQGQKGIAASPAVVEAQQKAALEDTRREGYDEGYAAGLAEGQMQAQADLATVQQHVQNALMALQQANTEREQELVRQSLSLIRQTLHHVIGHAVRHYGPELFEHHLRNLLPLLSHDEVLTLRIHPSARGFHEKLALPQAAIMGMPMNVKSDSTLGSTDAVVEWANGGVENKLAQHLEAIDELLLGAGAAALPVEARADLGAVPQGTPQAAPVAPQPEAASESLAPAPEDTLEDAAAHAARERARQLLGDDDDDLVDALK